MATHVTCLVTGSVWGQAGLTPTHACAPEPDEVRAGRAAPTAAATQSMQQAVSSSVVDPLRNDAMVMPGPVEAHDRVRTQRAHRQRSQ